MNQWIDQILSLAGTHPHLLGLFIFASAAAEAIIVVGALFPGTAIILAASGIAGAANLPLWPLVLWATVGAALGDGVSYWIGHHYGPALNQRWPFSARPQLLEKGESFFKRHGGKSVFLGRFVPGVKAVVPVVAGVARMSIPRFAVANISSGVVWAASHVLPAAAAGVLIAAVGSISDRLLAAFAAAVIGLFLAYLLAHLLVVKAAPWFIGNYQMMVARLATSRIGAARLIAQAADPRDPRLVGGIIWSALLILAVIGFAGVIEDVITRDTLTLADVSISQFVQSVRTEPLDRIMITITEFGDGVVVVITAAALLTALAVARRWRVIALVSSAFAITAISVPLIKLILQRQRPIDIYSGAELFAFPSGHSTFTTLLLATLALLISPHLGLRGQIAIWTAAILGSLAVGLSRIYLGAHWPSDVVGGVLFGLFICSLLALLLRYKTSVQRASLWSSVLAGIVFIGFGAAHVHFNATGDLSRYAPVNAPTVLSETDWRASGWERLPQQRVDLFGETEEPLTFQYAGGTGQLTQVLQKSGWHGAELSSGAGFLRLLSPATQLASMPPWPLLHDGKWPILMLTRTRETDDRRFVLRLWPSGYAVTTKSGRVPLLIGSITEETVRHPYSALTTMSDEPVSLAVPSAIAERLGQFPGFTVKPQAFPSGVKVNLITAVPEDKNSPAPR
ncbi:bifunctional DedA family/phosphatase PAP2 family protein [Roseibium aggregatum]|uniref:Phosphatase PAP2 family protein n=1 Tax=Roseibium aggregatum TaxID=187304 RepID=A0A926S4C9_9HYPH|nr:bifunctional DedA family/phosphatase PAP2 family protein [Roseibium aggregatum]MBD1546248.1 phosphatase PAP2 family protein [Roseibium aggregatum]